MITTTVTCSCENTRTVSGCGEPRHVLAAAQLAGWDNPSGGEQILSLICLAELAAQSIKHQDQNAEADPLVAVGVAR